MLDTIFQLNLCGCLERNSIGLDLINNFILLIAKYTGFAYLLNFIFKMLLIFYYLFLTVICGLYIVIGYFFISIVHYLCIIIYMLCRNTCIVKGDGYISRVYHVTIFLSGTWGENLQVFSLFIRLYYYVLLLVLSINFCSLDIGSINYFLQGFTESDLFVYMFGIGGNGNLGNTGGPSGPSGGNPNPHPGQSVFSSVVNPDEYPRRRTHFLQAVLNGTFNHNPNKDYVNNEPTPPFKNKLKATVHNRLYDCHIHFNRENGALHLTLGSYSHFNSIQDLQKGPFFDCPIVRVNSHPGTVIWGLRLDNICYAHAVDKNDPTIQHVTLPNVLTKGDSHVKGFHNHLVETSDDDAFMTLRGRRLR